MHASILATSIDRVFGFEYTVKYLQPITEKYICTMDFELSRFLTLLHCFSITHKTATTQKMHACVQC